MVEGELLVLGLISWAAVSPDSQGKPTALTPTPKTTSEGYRPTQASIPENYCKYKPCVCVFILCEGLICERLAPTASNLIRRSIHGRSVGTTAFELSLMLANPMSS